MLATALLPMVAQESYSGTVVADEGAWCWFADPRALHYENEAGTINATYLGYIDVHGNVKATQYDWVKHRKTDVLIRSYFQPDDHNNPTFVVLPDERVMIFYTRHTDEAKIWYRISQKPGDITDLGDEKYLVTANNTTYPSPFIMSDDPNHIYLCWRGIGWHPTIARITMPDANDDCSFDFGPKQIVQSLNGASGVRPYAKYQSNGKDKIYLSYTSTHPDNEGTNWLYFNVIDINGGNGPILRDIKGTELKKVADGPFSVNKTDSYVNNYPYTIVDKTSDIRNWVWQVALDKDENPVIAFPHINGDKTYHWYWYGRWTGTEWKRVTVSSAGHAFHQNWDKTERCYSGGMSLDPDNINDLYLSIPTKDGAYDRDGVYEIWKYTIDDDGTVSEGEQITYNSEKNNFRPYVIPGSKNSPMRLGWVNGDYYYWMVNKNYPKGYPTNMRCDYAWQEELTPEDEEAPRTDCWCLSKDKTLNLLFEMNTEKYEGKLFSMGFEQTLDYSLDKDFYPVITIGSKSYRSQNRLLTSDDWALNSTGTNGDNHPTKVSSWVLTLTYDGKVLTTYRNGLVDQVIEIDNLEGGTASAYGADYSHSLVYQSDYYACASPITVQALVSQVQHDYEVARWSQLPTALVNGDFEGNYSVQSGSGVTSDRAIYVPEGWTVSRMSPDKNDLTALRSGDLYFDRFFGSLTHPDNHGEQTYWIRQNWGTPTLTLSQEVRLPAGEYTLTCDLWKSGLGGDAYLMAQAWGETAIMAPTVENKEAWQQLSLTFESDGDHPTTIQLQAKHNSDNTEKIIGFDNVVLTKKEPVGIGRLTPADEAESSKFKVQSSELYNLTGQKVVHRTSSGGTLPKGIYIQGNRKIVK